MQTIESLRQILFRSGPRLSVAEPVPGFPVLHATIPEATAEIALHGAHVLSWHPTGKEPVLYTSPAAIFEAGTPVRGGIPICWPWFGAHPDDPSKPQHGLARNRFWHLSEVENELDSITLVFTLSPDDETRALWPHEFAAKLSVQVGSSLTVVLETTNFSDEPVVIGAALHTYLAVGDLSRVSVEGLEGADFLDTVGEATVRTQHGPVTIDREVDRIYRSEAAVRLADPARERAVTIEKAGSRSTVVWNPWIEKAAAIHDLPDDGYRDFVCVEVANADRDLVTIHPGIYHTLATRISV